MGKSAKPINSMYELSWVGYVPNNQIINIFTVKPDQQLLSEQQKYKGVSHMTMKVPHCAKLHRIDVKLISSCVKDLKGITPMESQFPLSYLREAEG